MGVEQIADCHHPPGDSLTRYQKHEQFQNCPSKGDECAQLYWFAEGPEVAIATVVGSCQSDVKANGTSSSGCGSREALNREGHAQESHIPSGDSCDTGQETDCGSRSPSLHSGAFEYQLDSNAKRKQYSELSISNQKSASTEAEAQRNNDLDQIARLPVTVPSFRVGTTSPFKHANGCQLPSENSKEADVVTRSPQKRIRKEIKPGSRHP